MWGAQADNRPVNCNTLAGQTHVRCEAEIADRQLGKMLDEVKKQDVKRGGKTLVVLTADHGATYGKNFYGKRIAPNLPTEECFTSPIATATEGTVCNRLLKRSSLSRRSSPACRCAA